VNCKLALQIKALTALFGVVFVPLVIRYSIATLQINIRISEVFKIVTYLVYILLNQNVLDNFGDVAQRYQKG
jgi:hypothetical protein